MGRAEQVRRFVESAGKWCHDHGHVCLIGDMACYVCGEEFSRRRMQVVAAENPTPWNIDDIRFVAAGETFQTPEGQMRAANGVCQCGRRASQHLKFFPWQSVPGGIGVPECEGYVPLERGTAPGSQRIPGAKEIRREGTQITHTPGGRCLCGHLPADHTNTGGCLRCSCRHLTVR